MLQATKTMAEQAPSQDSSQQLEAISERFREFTKHMIASTDAAVSGLRSALHQSPKSVAKTK
jgi:hypothetical protein